LQTRHAGEYRVVITDVDGALTSDVAHLTAIAPPRITPTLSLQNWALDLGTNSSFVVTASGTEPLSFQWRLDGRDLAGETQDTLTLTNLQQHDVQRRANRYPNADLRDAHPAGTRRAPELDWRRTPLPRGTNHRLDRRRVDRISARRHAAGEFALGRHGGLLPHYRAMTSRIV